MNTETLKGKIKDNEKRYESLVNLFLKKLMRGKRARYYRDFASFFNLNLTNNWYLKLAEDFIFDTPEFAKKRASDLSKNDIAKYSKMIYLYLAISEEMLIKKYGNGKKWSDYKKYFEELEATGNPRVYWI